MDEQVPLWRQYRKEYSVWAQMLNRCRSPKHPQYKYWGGRGIKVCEEWRIFANFLADMGERPGKEYTLERKDTDGHYEPSNCGWATWITQNNNQRRNIKLTYEGRTQTMAQWAREVNIPYDMLRSRFRYGWPTEKILTVPKNQHHNKY